MLLPENVNEEIVQPQEGVNPDSQSEGEIQEGQGDETPAQNVVPEEKVGFGDPRHPDHERFVELREAQKRAEQEKAQLLELLQKQNAPVQQPTIDEFANMTPEEQMFFRNLDKRYETKFQKMLKEKEENFSRILQGQQKVMSELFIDNLRTKFTDITPNSNEEQLVLEKMARGYSRDDAYKVVMFDKMKQTVQQKAKQTTQQKVQAKRNANVESNSIPANSGLPPKKESWREQVNRLWDEGMPA